MPICECMVPPAARGVGVYPGILAGEGTYGFKGTLNEVGTCDSTCGAKWAWEAENDRAFKSEVAQQLSFRVALLSTVTLLEEDCSFVTAVGCSRKGGVRAFESSVTFVTSSCLETTKSVGLLAGAKELLPIKDLCC